jgi:hypothetical protein
MDIFAPDGELRYGYSNIPNIVNILTKKYIITRKKGQGVLNPPLASYVLRKCAFQNNLNKRLVEF